jgi:hypothetical protein
MRSGLQILLAATLWLALPTSVWAGDVPRKAFAAANLQAKRFAEADVTTVAIAPGSEVEVIAEKGDLVRVRYQTSFGWVEATALTDQPPVSADKLQLDMKGPPSFR